MSQRWVPMVLTFLALALGALAGAACGRNASAQVVAPPPLPPPPTAGEVPPAMVRGARYQYFCQTDLNNKIWKPDLVATLNRFGADGWRLLPMRQNQASDQYCFERAY